MRWLRPRLGGSASREEKTRVVAFENPAAPHPSEQRELLRSLRRQSEAKPRKRAFAYLVPAGWYRRWEAHVADPRRARAPGPIDNSPLLRGGRQQAQLQADEDFVVLTRGEWRALQAWYGGEPEVRRPVVQSGRGSYVELFPLRVKVTFRKGARGEQRRSSAAQFVSETSAGSTVRQLRQELCSKLLVADAERAHVLSAPPGGSPARETDLDATLSALGWVDGQVVVVEVLSPERRLSRTAPDVLPELRRARSSAAVAAAPPPIRTGLSNLGNTCFLNSAVQALAHTEPLTQYFLSGRYRGDVNRTNPLGMRGEIALAYAALLDDMWSGRAACVTPSAFKAKLARFAPQFSGFRQHDSHELLCFLLDGLHEDLNRVVDKPYNEVPDSDGRPDRELADISWRNHVARNQSVVVELFHGLLRSTLTCPRCDKTSVTFDPFFSLALPIVKGGGGLKRRQKDIYRCIEAFTSEEQLGSGEQWYCPACRKHRRAFKTVALWDVPEVLVVQRFGGRGKITTTVDFPLVGLDLSHMVKGPASERAVYDLFAVSNHMGGMGGGHYTATAKTSDGQWWTFNDSIVRAADPQKIVSGAAYVLFYRRRQAQSAQGQTRGARVSPRGGSVGRMDAAAAAPPGSSPGWSSLGRSQGRSRARL